jgi:UDP-N-acetyl-D-mannosaminuronic acid dehydrogenase
LPTAAILATHGSQVIGVDVNPMIVDTVNSGKIHIVEPDLDAAVWAATRSGRLRAALAPETADVFLIAVPTPFKGEHREPEFRYIEAACAALAPVLKAGDLVILESTSPVGATEQVSNWLAAARTDLTFPHQAGEGSDVRIAHCPERVLPGRVLFELINNDRVIGGLTPKCSEAAAAFYRRFVRGECIVAQNARVAELCKLTENAFRDVNIAFANELSLICDRLDIDVWELIRLANRHPRVSILQPGPGVGGHCIAVDPWFIVHSAPEQSRLIRTARDVNDGKPHWVIDRIGEALDSFVAQGRAQKDVTIALFGLAFKPDVDDLRESPAVEIAAHLLARVDAEILAVEPHIKRLPEGLEGCRLADMEEAARADIVVLLVRHRPFLAFAQRNWRDGQKLIDACGLLSDRRKG